MNVQASANLNDIFWCLEQNAACQPTNDGQADCTIAGDMQSDAVGWQLPRWELARTQVIWTSSLGPPTPNPTGYDYFWPVLNDCTAATTLRI